MPCGIFCGLCLKVLVQNCLHSYKIALDDDGKITNTLLTTDRHPADDLCVLSAMCLVKLSLLDSKSPEEVLRTPRAGFLLQATALLEFAWTHSKSNFQISLILVRLYSYLGCGSLAARAYQRLALKQIQVDTLSYTLFDRISTFHPHPFSHSPDGLTQYPSPLEQLSKHHKFYEGAIGQINNNVWLSFKYGSYNSIFEIREVAERLSQSLSSIMSLIEIRRTSRLVKPSTPLMVMPNDSLELSK
jgi:N-terminal acetyltransferase B complex non-catalytic subunit